MLSNEIVTFATLLNVAVLAATFWQARKMNAYSSFEVAGNPRKTAQKTERKTSFADFELPGLPPVEPVKPAVAAIEENVTAAAPLPSVAHDAVDSWTAAPVERRSVRHRDFARPTVAQKTCVHPGKAAELLVEYMNAEGLTGLYTAAEIDWYWSLVVELYDLEFISPQFVRSAMGRFHQGQKRLNTPEFLAIRQRTGQTRANLYRIPKCRVLAGHETDEAGIASAQLVAGSVHQPSAGAAGKAPARQAASQATRRDGAKRPVNTDIFAEAA